MRESFAAKPDVFGRLGATQKALASLGAARETRVARQSYWKYCFFSSVWVVVTNWLLTMRKLATR